MPPKRLNIDTKRIFVRSTIPPAISDECNQGVRLKLLRRRNFEDNLKERPLTRARFVHPYNLGRYCCNPVSNRGRPNEPQPLQNSPSSSLHPPHTGTSSDTRQCPRSAVRQLVIHINHPRKVSHTQSVRESPGISGNQACSISHHLDLVIRPSQKSPLSTRKRTYFETPTE